MSPLKVRRSISALRGVLWLADSEYRLLHCGWTEHFLQPAIFEKQRSRSVDAGQHSFRKSPFREHSERNRQLNVQMTQDKIECRIARHTPAHRFVRRLPKSQAQGRANCF